MRGTVAVAALLLVGCATSPTSSQDATAVQSVVAAGMSRAAHGTGTLVVRRDRGFYGMACDYVIRVDGRFIANLDTGQEATIYPLAGEHSIEVSTGGAWCATSNSGGTLAIVEEGKRYTYRAGQRGLGMFVEPSDEAASPPAAAASAP